MTTLSTLRPIIRRMIEDGTVSQVMPDLWAQAYAHVDTDITADSITLMIAEIRGEIALELQSLPESEGD